MDQQTNVWCSNCRGHGHLPTKCSTPIGSAIEGPICTVCGGSHPISKCWNLGKVVAQVQAQNQEQWSKKDNSKVPYSITSKKPFTRPNVGPPYKPGDGRPRWNDTYNAQPVWNGPPTNPETHRYGPPEKGKMFVCYNYGELGHMLKECPHPRKQVDYEPLRGHCKEKGHTANTCMAPAPIKQIQIEEFEDLRNVNYIKQTCPDEKEVYITRSQAKAQAKVVPRESESEHASNGDSEKPSDRVIRIHLKVRRVLLLKKGSYLLFLLSFQTQYIYQPKLFLQYQTNHNLIQLSYHLKSLRKHQNPLFTIQVYPYNVQLFIDPLKKLQK